MPLLSTLTCQEQLQEETSTKMARRLMKHTNDTLIIIIPQAESKVMGKPKTSSPRQERSLLNSGITEFQEQ
jgi:hypothetical protein